MSGEKRKWTRRDVSDAGCNAATRPAVNAELATRSAAPAQDRALSRCELAPSFDAVNENRVWATEKRRHKRLHLRDREVRIHDPVTLATGLSHGHLRTKAQPDGDRRLE